MIILYDGETLGREDKQRIIAFGTRATGVQYGWLVFYALSGETKPANPGDNWILVELDTDRRFIGQGGSWVEKLNPGFMVSTATPTPGTHSVVGTQHSFPGGTSTFLRADGTFAAPPGGGGWTIVSKANNTTRTSTTTIAADPELVIALAASTRYLIRGVISFDTTALGDFKYRHRGPASPTLVRIHRKAILPAGTSWTGIAVDVAFSAADVALAGTGTTGGMVWIEGVVHNGLTAGNFDFAWAQNTLDVGNTTVHAGSYLEYLTY